MAEYSANAVQTVQPGQAVVFTNSVFPCNRGLIQFREDSGAFLLRGWVPRNLMQNCCCNGPFGNTADYFVNFHANIAVPDGQTAGAIQVTALLNGSPIPSSTAISTPAAVNQYNNVSIGVSAPVPCNCCETLTIVNTSTIPILVQNANLVITRPDLAVSY